MSALTLGNGLAHGVVCFVFYVLAVLVVLRVDRTREPALLVVVLAAVVGVAGPVVFAWLGPAFNAWVLLASYSFLTLGFLVGFGAVYKSLSLRILLRLLDTPGRTGSYQAIFDAYLIEDSYQNRLSVIVDKGLVDLQDGQLSLTARGRVLAQRVRAIQRAFGITHSG